MRRLAVGILALIFVAVGILSASTVSASERPYLGKIKVVGQKSVVLPLKFSDLERKKVVIRVRVREAGTDKVEIRKFKVKLGKEGREKITVANLMPNTKYKFSVKVRKQSTDNYSDTSRTRSATTKP